jgi:hypothetical protein
MPQWRPYLPSSGDSRPAGMLYPSPAWERGLNEELNSGPSHLLAVHRLSRVAWAKPVTSPSARSA